MTTSTPATTSSAASAVLAFYDALAAGDPPEPYHGAQQVADQVLARITADIDSLALANREILEFPVHHGGTAYITHRVVRS